VTALYNTALIGVAQTVRKVPANEESADLHRLIAENANTHFAG
jgi:hypothetical protein